MFDLEIQWHPTAAPERASERQRGREIGASEITAEETPTPAPRLRIKCAG